MPPLVLPLCEGEETSRYASSWWSQVGYELLRTYYERHERCWYWVTFTMQHDCPI